MAIVATDLEKAKTRKALGFLGVDFTYTSLVFSTPASSSETIFLERALNSIADTDSYAIFQDYLAQLATIETKITTAQSTSIAVKSLGKGDVVLNSAESYQLWEQHYLVAQRLSTLLYVSIRYHPIFDYMPNSQIGIQ